MDGPPDLSRKKMGNSWKESVADVCGGKKQNKRRDKKEDFCGREEELNQTARVHSKAG